MSTERTFWSRHDLLASFLITIAGMAALFGLMFGLMWLLLHDSGVALGRAESANRVCAEHGGVQSTGGRGPSVATCADGTAHSLPVWISREEWSGRDDH